MLNKRTSDILYIALYVIVVAVVVGVRLFLIGFYDDRIASNEADNERLRADIIAEAQIVEAHRESPLPTLFSLHRMMPEAYDSDALRRHVTNQVNRAGVMHTETTSLSITIGSEALGQGQLVETPYQSIAQDALLYEVTIVFNVNHTGDGSRPSEIAAVLDRFEVSNQLFLLHSIRYEPYEFETTVRISYYAVYQRN